ncbi:peptidoglycan/LPS O-acetylase OafA/YrhL [Phycicoccus badiiscoriae]|uniref:Peptidoglycan/LPS O-acetylase OafA/YrhL n=1 Tax=Pedococcus badiiscoriae TaxID=642776 RepID=A0A852WKG4_9MICO|nr:acyltransferase family protein [Pedococcus badiiscoriae]NYG05782.1 peptidoglycan/LPS O-acetylase OafA/YrhL [Pedococcus badiiscoriae]
MSTTRPPSSSSSATQSLPRTQPSTAPVPPGPSAGRVDAYRPEIQGLRAVAVGLVVLFHLWPLRVSGGYVGVDVFFVISGYLITSHIYREIAQTGTLQVTRFWARRIRRLLPASLLVLALSAIGVLLWAPATVWPASARQLGASALYVQNWALAFDSVDYMALDNVPTVVQHYWSLSVEEQFYALWPLLIVGLLALQGRARRRTSAVSPASADQKRRLIMGGLAVLAVASLVWSVINTADDQAFAYMSTFTRAWEFAAGAITGLVTLTVTGRRAQVLGWLGVVAVLVSGCLYTERSAFPGWIALAPVLGTVAIILAGRGAPTTAGWWLSLRPARFIGDISYSIYLIHWPLIVLIPYATGHSLVWTEKVGLLAVTVVLAWLSKTLVEDPLRTRPLLAAAPWRAFAFAAAGMLVLVAATVGINAEVKHREAMVATAAKARLAAGVTCLGPAALDPANKCGNVAGDGAPVVPPEMVALQSKNDIFARCQQQLESADLKTCHLGQQTNPRRTVALLGDSHAGALTPLLDELGKQLGWDVVAATKASCPTTTSRRVVPGETGHSRQAFCESFNRAVAREILGNPKITDVFVTSYSSAYTWANAPGGTLADPGPDGFKAAWKQFTDAGKRVHVIRDVPGTGKRSIPDCLALVQHPDDCAVARKSALAKDVAVAAARSLGDPNVTVLDLTPQFCDDVTCFAQVGNVIVYRDRSHLSIEYARLLAPYLARQLGTLPK